jgi:hypothetical protein
MNLASIMVQQPATTLAFKWKAFNSEIWICRELTGRKPDSISRSHNPNPRLEGQREGQ